MEMVDTLSLGQQAAKAIGWIDAYPHGYWNAVYRPIFHDKINRDQVKPMIMVANKTIAIQDKDWKVVFYFMDEPLMGQPIYTCGILGVAPGPIMETILNAWDIPAVTHCYQEQEGWLKRNPMYRMPVKMKNQTKSKLSPKQLTVPK